MVDKDRLIELIRGAQGNLTQNEFAERCGISSSNLTRIYRGDQVPSPKLLKKIADYTDKKDFYANLMIASGYWDDGESPDLFDPPNINEFAKRLRKERVQLNLTVEELSKQSKVPAERINAFENEVPFQHYDWLDIVSLARSLGVYSNYLKGLDPIRDESEYAVCLQDAEQLSYLAKALPAPFATSIVPKLNLFLSSFSLLNEYPPEIKDKICEWLSETFDLIDNMFNQIGQCARIDSFVDSCVDNNSGYRIEFTSPEGESDLQGSKLHLLGRAYAADIYAWYCEIDRFKKEGENLLDFISRTHNPNLSKLLEDIDSCKSRSN